ncbi:hypothetical protein L3Q82_022620 [Scortum barcoo]|uniref:Uncharacterized protein n=1 Tax=Scortum barcoo TaxID=214431 RepID=A0ACB8X3G4_9TELE|nr:hypothetical protein L3Q82_022620 [Scortum barcoo]
MDCGRSSERLTARRVLVCRHQMGTTETTEDLFRTLVDCCLRNNLQINAGKTKELVVECYKYLGVHLNDSLDWSDNT